MISRSRGSSESRASSSADLQDPRAGDAARVARAGPGRPNVQDDGTLPFVDQPAQVLDRDPRHPEHLVEPPPLPPLQGHEDRQRPRRAGPARRCRARRAASRTRSIARWKTAAADDSGARPEQGPAAVVEQERRQPRADRARHRGCDGREARDELREEERGHPPALEDATPSAARRSRATARSGRGSSGSGCPGRGRGQNQTRIGDERGGHRHEQDLPGREVALDRERPGDDRGPGSPGSARRAARAARSRRSAGGRR